jgi:hypothetical protein
MLANETRDQQGTKDRHTVSNYPVARVFSSKLFKPKRSTIIEFLFGWVAMPMGDQSPNRSRKGFPALTNHFPFFLQRK